MRVTGTVKWFRDVSRDGGDQGAGYGFLTPDSGGSDIFVHRTSLGSSCMQDTKDGQRSVLFPLQRVAFDIEDSPRGPRAKAVELI